MKGRFMAIAAALVAAVALGGTTSVAGAADNAGSTPKEPAPALVKLVLEDSTGTWGATADAEVGQDIPFRIELSLPERICESEHLWLRVTDTLPAGMDVNPDSIRVTLGSDDLTELFAVACDQSVLLLEAEELARTGLPHGCELVITYTARLSASSPVGGAGSVNTAFLELEADGDYCKTPESQTAVFTYRLVVTKVDAADHAEKLGGARFVLMRDDGLFAVVREGCLVSWTDDKAAATQLTSNAAGRIVVAGLDSDTYTLVETSPPAGYQLLSGGIPLSLEARPSFDMANGQGALNRLALSSGASSSSGDTATGTVYCTIENVREPARAVPATGDSTANYRLFALVGAVLSGGALWIRTRSKRARKAAYRPAHMAAAILVAVTCLFARTGCLPIRALAQGPATTEAEAVADYEALPDADPEGLVITVPADSASSPRLEASPVRASSPVGVGVADEADIPRSTENSYINVLNMSYENAYVMINDLADFAYSGDSPTNSYVTWSVGNAFLEGPEGQAVSSMVLYRGAAGSHGAGSDTWGIDTITDTTGNGLVAVWFKDAGVLSDTGEPVSMLLKLHEYRIMPNYVDYYRYMSGNTSLEARSSYRNLRAAGSPGFPLLYIFQSGGVDQTNPANARVWMNAVWCSGQVWEVTFYRSSATPNEAAEGAGYALSSLGLSDEQRVSTATNGKMYLARQYCYDLDVPGIRWLSPSDGSYSSTGPFVTSGNSLFAKGGAYITSAGAESFTWVTGATGSSYVSTSTNLKNDTYGGLTYWLHDYYHDAGGTWEGYRWQSSGTNHNTDWRNALASDVLPTSSFSWVGTSCATGINLNSQFTGTGSLRVSKTVDDGSTAEFPFRLDLEAASYTGGSLSWSTLGGSFAYTLSAADGTTIESGSLQSGDPFALADGQTLVVNGIPEGTRYTVTETSHAGYQPRLEGAAETIVTDEFAGTIVNGATSEIAVRNVRLLAPTGWTIIKQGDRGEALAGAEFTLRFYAEGSSPDVATRTWVLTSDRTGCAVLDEAHLVSGDAFYLDENGAVGLPLGTVTVEETKAPDGYVRDATVRSFDIRDVGGRLECAVPAALVVENERLTGSLTVSKLLEGTGADAGRDFSFVLRVSLEGEPLDGVYGGTTFTEGVAAFTLKAGQTRTFDSLPAGSTYELSEEALPGYEVSWSGRTGAIVADYTAEACATNSYSATGTARILLTKVYDTNGPGLADGQFTFELHADSPEGAVLASSTCDADGNVAFELDFDQESIGESFTYYVTEVNDGQSGVDYDTHAAKVVITVTNGGDGTLGFDIDCSDATFSNSYHSYVLPDTGFGGIAGCVGFGVVVVGAAAAALKRRRAQLG